MKKKKNLLLFLWLFSITNMFACSCINELNVIQSIRVEGYIFVGYVNTIEKVKIEHRDLFKVTFSVESYFKGSKCKYKKDVVVYTNSEGDMCGCSFELKKRYIVYANVYKDIYVTKSKLLKNIIITNTCTRTKLYDEEEYRVLKKNAQEKIPKKSKRNIQYQY